MTSTSNNTTRLIGAALCAAGLAFLSACRGDRSNNPPRQFFPDMDDSPKWKPQSESEFFTDGRVMRRPVAGVVPYGADADPAAPDRADYLKDNPQYYLGRASAKPDAPFVDYMPVPVTMDLIKRGQERFNIYCSVCHGFDGKGSGMVGDTNRRTGWSYALPNFMDETGKYTDRTQQTGKDGYIFSTIRNGVLNPDGTWKMPPYGHAVKERDAWAIVAYIRTLQAAFSGKLDEVPDAERANLLQHRPPAKPAEPAPAPGAPAAPAKSAPKGGV